MELQIDNTKKYAIALAGGGARGGYEIGVWKALSEAGIEYEALSGTSVGALNGALYAMGDLERALYVWENLELSKVINLPAGSEEDFLKLVSGNFEMKNLMDMAPGLLEIIKNKGLDISPLRAWVREVVEPAKVRASGIKLYTTTVGISDKKAIVREISSLPDDEMWDMLLASAYHPTFKPERLGGKYYTDGGFVDSLPVTPLLDAGYRDIIAVRIPGKGYEKKVHLPENAEFHMIEPYEELGGSLNFSREQALQNLKVGYFDAQRMLYGLYGEYYYVEKTLDQIDARDLLADYVIQKDKTVRRLREVYEDRIPEIAKALDRSGRDENSPKRSQGARSAPLKRKGDYYDILLALAEEKAVQKKMEKYCIYEDRAFIRMALMEK